jgi:hypothetical protein
MGERFTVPLSHCLTVSLSRRVPFAEETPPEEGRGPLWKRGGGPCGREEGAPAEERRGWRRRRSLMRRFHRKRYATASAPVGRHDGNRPPDCWNGQRSGVYYAHGLPGGVT